MQNEERKISFGYDRSVSFCLSLPYNFNSEVTINCWPVYMCLSHVHILRTYVQNLYRSHLTDYQHISSNWNYCFERLRNAYIYIYMHIRICVRKSFWIQNYNWAKHLKLSLTFLVFYYFFLPSIYIVNPIRRYL